MLRPGRLLLRPNTAFLLARASRPPLSPLCCAGCAAAGAPQRPARSAATSAAAAPAVALPEQAEQAQHPFQQPCQQQQQQRVQPKKDMHVLVKNGQVVPCTLPSGAWLEAAPRGAYTTARTVGNGTSVFELVSHIRRLADSAALMMAAPDGATAGAPAAALPPAAAAVADPERLRPRLLASLRAAVRAYQAACGGASGEVKLTVLVTWSGCQHEEAAEAASQDGSSSSNSNGAAASSLQPAAAAEAACPPSGAALADIYVHASALPPRPKPPVRVVMRGAPRQNAAAKDSEWVRQRKALEEGLPADVNEAIMVGQGGALYEGLTSNFFAAMDGKLYTAGEGVLAGTVRHLALEVAQREGIPAVLEAPLLADMPGWEGCFITSTSRLLLPVDEASLFAEEPLAEEQVGQQEGQQQQPAARRFERGGLVGRLEQLVLAEVAACSEPLFD